MIYAIIAIVGAVALGIYFLGYFHIWPFTQQAKVQDKVGDAVNGGLESVKDGVGGAVSSIGNIVTGGEPKKPIAEYKDCDTVIYVVKGLDGQTISINCADPATHMSKYFKFDAPPAMVNTGFGCINCHGDLAQFDKTHFELAMKDQVGTKTYALTLYEFPQ